MAFVTMKPKELVDKLREYRRTRIVHIHTSIVWKINDFAIEIYTDAGRCTRPIYLVNNNNMVINNNILDSLDKGNLRWNNLLVGSLNTHTTANPQKNEINPGVIEFIDVQEEDNCMIAINYDKLKEHDSK